VTSDATDAGPEERDGTALGEVMKSLEGFIAPHRLQLMEDSMGNLLSSIAGGGKIPFLEILHFL
jgi:hypothetical protein